MSVSNYGPLIKLVNNLVFDHDFIALNRYTVNSSVLALKPFKENEISSVLAWLLDPREGHMQGDYFLKSLIAAIYQNANDKQMQELPNATCMAVRSLSNIKVMQEVSIKQSQERRIDLLLADVDSKTLIVIERKDGSSAHTGQLADYYEWTKKYYQDWKTIFVLSDSHNKNHGDNYHASFVQLDDEWLNTAIQTLLQKNSLPAQLEYTFRDIHDHIFGDKDEKQDPVFKKYNDLLKIVAHKHADTIRRLTEQTVRLNDKQVSLINISPVKYFSQVLLKSDSYSEEELELFKCIQSFHETIHQLADFNEFDLLADKVMKQFPLIFAEPYQDRVGITMARHHNEDGDYWPYYLEVLLDEENSVEGNSYIISVAAHKKCNPNAVHIAEEFAESYGLKVRSNWQFKEMPLEYHVADLSLRDGTVLRKLLDAFIEKAKRLSALKGDIS